MGSLNDGFFGFDGFDSTTLWQAQLLPAGIKSWSYRLTAGADLGAADIHALKPIDQLSSVAGSVVLGAGAGPLPRRPDQNAATSIVPQFYQTIRTGTGNIDIAAGRDLQLRNSLATIYTAGAQAPTIPDFDVPIYSDPLGNSVPANFTMGGGNVTERAQGDIIHLVDGTVAGAPQLVADSSREMPVNW